MLNSGVFHVVYEALYGGTRKGGNFIHFLGSYLHPFPLPEPPVGATRLHDAIVRRPDDPVLLAQIEDMVRAAYGVTADEAAALDDVDVPGA